MVGADDLNLHALGVGAKILNSQGAPRYRAPARSGQHSMDDATPLFFPQLGPLYHALFPWAEMFLRVVVGLTLVPHGHREGRSIEDDGLPAALAVGQEETAALHIDMLPSQVQNLP